MDTTQALKPAQRALLSTHDGKSIPWETSITVDAWYDSPDPDAIAWRMKGVGWSDLRAIRRAEGQIGEAVARHGGRAELILASVSPDQRIIEIIGNHVWREVIETC